MTIVDEDGKIPYVEGSELTVPDAYQQYVQGRDPAHIADDHNIKVARVHEAIAYYYDHAERMMRLETNSSAVDRTEDVPSEDSESTDYDGETDGQLYWHSAILDHERKIQIVLYRLDDDGEIVDTLGDLDLQFDAESTYDKAVVAFVDYLERCCDSFDFYQGLRADKLAEQDIDQSDTATSDRADWSGSTPGDARDALFGDGLDDESK